MFLPQGVTDRKYFLTTDSREAQDLMVALWDNYSGIPGLLSARRMDEAYRKGRKGYVYDPIDRKYYNLPSGREITQQRLRSAVKRVSAEAGRRMKKETQQLIAGTIALTIWYNRTGILMDALYKTIWLISIGGFVFDDDFQRNLFYAFVLSQFGYLDNFAEQIDNGIQSLDGRAMTRAGMYGFHGNSMWQNIRIDQAREDGLIEGRRILGSNENHCHTGERPGCIELAAMGWVPISQLVPLGSAQCYCITTLESKVMTSNGWKSLNDIQVGDCVLTHKMRFKKVIMKTVKPSQIYHNQVYIHAPNGAWIGATDNHLWLTNDGWQNSNYIDSSNSQVYNIDNIKEDHYDSILSEMWEETVKQKQEGLLQTLPAALIMSMWENKGLQSERMQSLLLQGGGEKTMEKTGNKKQNAGCFEESRHKSPPPIRRHKMGYELENQKGWEAFHVVLGRQPEKNLLDLSLSMGMDSSQWINTKRISDSSQESRCNGRSSGESGIAGTPSTYPITRQNESRMSANELEFKMPELRKRFSGQDPNWKKTNILFYKMPVGTLLYDIEVDEDHSFCIEGIFAHNSNCLCRLEFR